jgi:hypothetical protein
MLRLWRQCRDCTTASPLAAYPARMHAMLSKITYQWVYRSMAQSQALWMLHSATTEIWLIYGTIGFKSNGRCQGANPEAALVVYQWQPLLYAHDAGGCADQLNASGQSKPRGVPALLLRYS